MSHLCQRGKKVPNGTLKLYLFFKYLSYIAGVQNIRNLLIKYAFSPMGVFSEVIVYMLKNTIVMLMNMYRKT